MKLQLSLAALALSAISTIKADQDASVKLPAADEMNTWADGDQERALHQDRMRYYPGKEVKCETDCLERGAKVFNCADYFIGDHDCKVFCSYICYIGDMNALE